jgi:hypothetical protein
VHAAASGGGVKSGSAVARVAMRACPLGAAATSPVHAPARATHTIHAPSRRRWSAIRYARATHPRAAVAEGKVEAPPTGAFHLHFGAGRLGMGLVFPAMRCVALVTALHSARGVLWHSHACREGVHLKSRKSVARAISRTIPRSEIHGMRLEQQPRSRHLPSHACGYGIDDVDGWRDPCSASEVPFAVMQPPFDEFQPMLTARPDRVNVLVNGHKPLKQGLQVGWLCTPRVGAIYHAAANKTTQLKNRG